MKQPTVDEMRRHIGDLLDKHEIIFNIECRRPSEAWAVCEFEEVSIPPIKSVLSYATALHEIGHIRGRYQTSRDMMVRESWAWRWAQQNALVWTPRMEEYRVNALAHASLSAEQRTARRPRVVSAAR
jgi:hypothetical protein